MKYFERPAIAERLLSWKLQRLNKEIVMKLNQLAKLLAAIALGSVSTASFAGAESGKISFKGSIIEAPCSISAESANQTVEMDQVSNSALKNGGKSVPTPFKISLIGCDLTEAKKSVTATFTGTPSAAQPNLLKLLSGTAKGASLAIADSHGTLIKLGEPSPATQLISTENTLEFTAYLQGDMTTPEGGGEAVAAQIEPGTFDTFAHFTLIYQ